jgi:anthranilate synthase component 2
MKRVVLVDNYDSFSYNLYQYFGEFADEVMVVKNDEFSCEEIERKFSPSHIVVSPGPCRPKEAGICEEVPLYFGGKIPVLGVCLGHQGICEAFGGRITYAKKLMHGKADKIKIESSPIFKGLPQEIVVARYHSLAAVDLPDALKVIGVAGDGEIMAVEHRSFPVFGVQFHPESIMTACGKQIIQNFLSI